MFKKIQLLLSYQVSIILLVLLITLRVNGQDNSKSLFVKVNDSSGNKLSNVTVTLFRYPGLVAVHNSITSSVGEAHFSNLNIGMYKILVSSVGYINQELDSIKLSELIKVDTILFKLNLNAGKLNSININAKKPLVENRSDITILNVDALLSNAGNTVLDVLSQAPNVDVDNNGNISVKGKGGVVVYIDGRQNYLSGTELGNYLKTIPASQADQIEIITQPSAKYDAAGNAGIINIKLKKNKQTGFNSNISLSYIEGIYPKSINSIILNYKKNRVNFYSNVSYNYSMFYTKRNLGRDLIDNTNNTNIKYAQDQNQVATTKIASASIGLTYIFSKKWDGGFLFTTKNYDRHDKLFDSSTFRDLNRSGTLLSYLNNFNSITNVWSDNSTSLNFKNTPDKNRELSIDLNFDKYKFRPNQILTSSYYDSSGNLSQATNPNPVIQKTENPSDIYLISTKADYLFNINHAKIEIGSKSSFLTSKNIADYYMMYNDTFKLNNNLSNIYNYMENINAFYVNFQEQMQKLNVQFGLRFEQTNSQGISNDKDKFSKSNFQAFPSAFFGFNFNSRNLISFSYSRRIDRPNYTDLNPFSFFNDPFTFFKGNSSLQPYFTHNLELTYNFKQALNIQGTYAITEGLIDYNLNLDEQSKILTYTRSNIFKKVSAGLTISYNARFGNWGNIFINDDIYNNHFTGIVNSIFINRNQTTNSFNLTQEFHFSGTWNAEIFASYVSSSLYAPWFFRGPRSRSSIAIGKDFKKVNVKVKLSDPLNIEKGFGSNDFNNVHTNIHFKEDSRQISFTCTYKFQKGLKSTFKNMYTPEEKNRL